MSDEWEDVGPKAASKQAAEPADSAFLGRFPSDASGANLTLPPGAGLVQSLVGYLPYWGMARTIRACRRMVEEKVALVRVSTELGHELLEHEKQKEIWANRADVIKGVKAGVLAKLDRAYAEQTEAKIALEDAETRLETARQWKATLSIINAENQQAELHEAKKRALDAKNRYEDNVSGSDSSFRRDMQKMTDNKRNYETLMKEKAADIETYGGEEKMPEFMRAFYDQLEDKLGFLKG